jgi:hypothetical protein
LQFFSYLGERKRRVALAACGLRDAAKARSISNWSFRAKRLANWKQDGPGIYNRRVFLSNNLRPGACRDAQNDWGVHIRPHNYEIRSRVLLKEPNEYRVVGTARKPKHVVTNDRILPKQISK